MKRLSLKDAIWDDESYIEFYLHCWHQAVSIKLLNVMIGHLLK